MDKPITEQDLARETKVPAIPSGTDAKTIAALKQLVEIREGIRGSPLDANVTWRDLLDNGLVNVKMVGGGTYTPPPGPIVTPPNPGPGPTPAPPPGVPPQPTGLTATGAIFNVILEWDNPAYGNDAVYSNHAYAEVWRYPSDNLAAAIRIGTSQTNFYVDSTGANSSNYYWVRFVNTSNVVGPYTAGVLGVTGSDPAAVLDIIEGEILESHLATALADRIDLIDAGSGVPGSVDARILAEQEARVDGDDALAVSISALAVSDDSGFDWVKIWYFDSAIESWGSNGGSPTVTSGWLKAYDHATDPYFTSPSALGVATVSYPLVKLFIKKTGSPVWDGRCYFQRDGDSTWDTARSVTLSEPTWSGGGTATVVFDLSGDADYTGTLKQIRVDLGASSDGTDYHEIDWIAIGRGAPAASTAQIAEIQSVRIGYCTVGGLTSTHGDRTACEAAGGTWNVGMPWATAVQQVGVTVGGDTSTIEERFTVQGTLEAQYTVKIDVNGHVSGFGLATEVVDGTPESAFIVRADKFAIIDPASTDPPTNTPSTDIVPFVIQDGNTYIRDAMIADATITRAKIGLLAVDDARIADLHAAKITAGTIDANRITVDTVVAKMVTANEAQFRQMVAGKAFINNAHIYDYLQSTDFNGNPLTNDPGTAGWHIAKDGKALFGNIKARGDIEASSIKANVALSAPTITGGTVNSATLNSVTINASTINSAYINSADINTGILHNSAVTKYVDLRDDAAYLLYHSTGAKILSDGSTRFNNRVAGGTYPIGITIYAGGSLGLSDGVPPPYYTYDPKTGVTTLEVEIGTGYLYQPGGNIGVFQALASAYHGGGSTVYNPPGTVAYEIYTDAILSDRGIAVMDNSGVGADSLHDYLYVRVVIRIRWSAAANAYCYVGGVNWDLYRIT